MADDKDDKARPKDPRADDRAKAPAEPRQPLDRRPRTRSRSF